MAWSLRAANSGTGTNVTSVQVNLTSGNTPVAGDRLVVCVGIAGSQTVQSVTDDRGNTYSHKGGTNDGSRGAEIWEAESETSLATLITVTLTAQASNLHVHVGVLAGAPATLAYSAAVVSNTSTTSHSCGELSAGNGDALVTMTHVSAAFSPTINADYLQLRVTPRAQSQYKFPTGSFTSDATWTSLETLSSRSVHLRIYEDTGAPPEDPRADGRLTIRAA